MYAAAVHLMRIISGSHPLERYGLNKCGINSHMVVNLIWWILPIKSGRRTIKYTNTQGEYAVGRITVAMRGHSQVA